MSTECDRESQNVAHCQAEDMTTSSYHTELSEEWVNTSKTHIAGRKSQVFQSIWNMGRLGQLGPNVLSGGGACEDRRLCA